MTDRADRVDFALTAEPRQFALSIGITPAHLAGPAAARPVPRFPAGCLGRIDVADPAASAAAVTVARCLLGLPADDHGPVARLLADVMMADTLSAAVAAVDGRPVCYAVAGYAKGHEGDALAALARPDAGPPPADPGALRIFGREAYDVGQAHVTRIMLGPAAGPPAVYLDAARAGSDTVLSVAADAAHHLGPDLLTGTRPDRSAAAPVGGWVDLGRVLQAITDGRPPDRLVEGFTGKQLTAAVAGRRLTFQATTAGPDYVRLDVDVPRGPVER